MHATIYHGLESEAENKNILVNGHANMGFIMAKQIHNSMVSVSVRKT